MYVRISCVKGKGEDRSACYMKDFLLNIKTHSPRRDEVRRGIIPIRMKVKVKEGKSVICYYFCNNNNSTESSVAYFFYICC